MYRNFFKKKQIYRQLDFIAKIEYLNDNRKRI